ncbi:MAG: polysaccharide deacetylase family protein [Clostridia bacterium]|nr:polysaccharide deacetylase family protein [Clostridia bacterium]MBR2389130.1 polysaccharide deacetylase family protein [Clostridia bacterium]
MKKIIKKTVITLFSALLIFSMATVSAFAEAGSWYTKRNKEHKQPTLDSSQEIIEKYGGYYVDKKHAESDEDKVVYLTFDAGYENGNIEKILDTLKEEDVKGAFFILENLIIRNPELVGRMADEGHTVCNHTAKHKDMTKVEKFEEFRAELSSLEALYTEKTGKTMAKFYRPPEGRYDEKSLGFANELGYKTIFWSLAYADWDNNNQPSAQGAMKILLDNIHNGAVILLHPTSSTNAEILPRLISALRAEGYRFGTLDELVSEKA